MNRISAAQLFCSYNRSSVFVCILFGIEIENGILSYTPITICAARIISFLSLKILNTTLSARLPRLLVTIVRGIVLDGEFERWGVTQHLSASFAHSIALLASCLPD